MKVERISNEDIKAPFKENFLRVRGINDIENYLNPNELFLEDPELLGEENCKKAWETVQKNIGKRAITIVDSDCDGYTSSAILILYMKNHFPDWNIDYFLHEGKQHGLEDVVKKIDLNEYDLVFLPDAGSNDDDFIKDYLNTDFIILDHHIRTDSDIPLPKNTVILNNQMAKDYKNKALCGAGVTWQFCRYIDKQMNTNYAEDLIDLVAVAIIADVMDLTTLENRYIVTKGLEDNFQNVFLKMLKDDAAYQLGDTLTPIGIAFYIVPKINSMCRMGEIDKKERMFLALIDPYRKVPCHKRGTAPGTLTEVVLEAARECTNTKAKQSRVQEKMAALCEKQIIENDLDSNKILTIVLDEDFDDMPSEMNGLTATKLANDYRHPTIIGRVNDEGMLRGSMRGLSNLDMPPFKKFLLSSDMFEYVEGHDNAAGISMPYKWLDKFIQWSNDELKDMSLDSKKWFVDFSVRASSPDLKDIIIDMNDLKNCWGQGMPEALLYIHDIHFKRSDVQVLGKKSDTVKITSNGISYMFFKRTPEEVKQLTSKAAGVLNVVGKANLNVYYSRVTPQIFVDDYEFKIEESDYGF